MNLYIQNNFRIFYYNTFHKIDKNKETFIEKVHFKNVFLLQVFLVFYIYTFKFIYLMKIFYLIKIFCNWKIKLEEYETYFK